MTALWVSDSAAHLLKGEMWAGGFGGPPGELEESAVQSGCRKL